MIIQKMKTETVKKRADVKAICKPYSWQILFLSALTVLQSVCQVGLAVLTRFVIDSAINGDGKLYSWGVALAMDVIALVVLYCWTSWLRASITDRFCAQCRQEILKSAVFSKDSQLRQSHSVALLSRAMEDVHTVCDGAISALPTLVGQIARLVAAFAAVWMISLQLAIVLLIAVCLIGGVATLMRPVLKRRHRAVRETDEKVMSTMQEDFQQLELIQGLQVQEQVLHRFSRRIFENLKQRRKRRAFAVSSHGIIYALAQMGSGVLLLWGASQLSTGALSYGTLIAMLQLLSLFRGPALELSSLWTRFSAMDVAAERLQTLLIPAEQVSWQTEITEVSAIVFENVTFHYPDDAVPVLKDFTKKISLDGWACLTGISGKGKTTLFKLILGLYKPQTGRVYLKTNRGEISCTEETRHLFAYVPQDYALFSGTVLENLQLVNPQMEEEALQTALKTACAEFVLDMGMHEQTLVGENNTGLSMGQLQRIAIARAVLMRRPILLLDECTSALDAQTEKAVLQSLRQANSQAILITHRPEALEDISGIVSVDMDNK